MKAGDEMTDAKRDLIAEIINMSDAEFAEFLQLAEQEFLAGHLPALSFATSAESACT